MLNLIPAAEDVYGTSTANGLADVFRSSLWCVPVPLYCPQTFMQYRVIADSVLQSLRND